MCDYSLELYHARPAVAGDSLTLLRFPSGSMGFTAPEQPQTAVCLTEGTTLTLSNIPKEIQDAYGVGTTTEVTFVRLDAPHYRDAVLLPTGKQLSLQCLLSGVKAEVQRVPLSPKVGHEHHHVLDWDARELEPA